MNPFNSNGFNLFSSPNLKYNSVNLSSGDGFPIVKVCSSGEFFPESHFICHTPICLSGPNVFDPDLDFDLLYEVQNVVAGFIQTRQRVEQIKSNVERTSSKWLFSEETRTNFAIPLGLDLDSLLTRMKRDSKSRIKKILKQYSNFSLTTTKSPEDLQFFSSLYSKCANRLSFSAQYRFELTNWLSLIEEHNWNLFILNFDDNPVAGCVTAKVNDGVDYTFMAYQSSELDFSRAMILFLYLHLSERESGFLSLGGGISENDALSKFKLSMGGEPQYFRRLKFANRKALNTGVSEKNVQEAMRLRWPR